MRCVLFCIVAPRNMLITPRQSSYQPGDTIQCSAEGNPAPSYQWTDLTNGTVIQGAVLVISKVMVNGGYAFQCSATNQYNGVMYDDSTTIVFSVTSAGIHADHCRFVSLRKPVVSASAVTSYTDQIMCIVSTFSKYRNMWVICKPLK